MSNFEFFGEPYPQTSQPEMDPVLRSKIIAFAEDGHDYEALEEEEEFGPENVRRAATNNEYLLSLLESADGGFDAA